MSTPTTACAAIAVVALASRSRVAGRTPRPRPRPRRRRARRRVRDAAAAVQGRPPPTPAAGQRTRRSPTTSRRTASPRPRSSAAIPARRRSNLPIPAGLGGRRRQDAARGLRRDRLHRPVDGRRPADDRRDHVQADRRRRPGQDLRVRPGRAQEPARATRAGDGGDAKLGGFDAFQIGATLRQGRQQALIAQKTVVIPAATATGSSCCSSTPTAPRTRSGPLMDATSRSTSRPPSRPDVS